MPEPTHALKLEYCVPCNYLNLAHDLIGDILKRWGPYISSLEIVPTSWGTFEVSLDDEVIFSKWALGRHAKRGEVLGLIESRLGAPIEGYEDHEPEVIDENGFPIWDASFRAAAQAKAEARARSAS